ncbi:MAG: DUF1345 domain-containing protein [Croceibacterium sp.]
MPASRKTAKQAVTIGNRLFPLRFLVFLALLPVFYFGIRAILPMENWKDGAALAFDGAALMFLVTLVPLFRQCDAAAIRKHAAANDANRVLVLVITSLLTMVVMVAITGEMAGAKQGDALSIGKLVGTLLLIWAFANSVYTMHYAHAFYSAEPKHGGDVGGLDFPGTKTPDYSDFAYFAFTLGMTFQTSDVDITTSPVRRIALLHCFAAFVFNIGVIAFTINVLGGG